MTGVAGLRALLGNRRLATVALLLIAFALVLRLALVGVTDDFRPQTDASDYDVIAHSISQGDRYPESELTRDGGPSAFRPPAFPHLLGVGYAVTGAREDRDRWRVARSVEGLLGTLTVALIGALGVMLFGALPGLTAMGLAALYPPLLLASASLFSEALFIPLALGALLAALVARDSSRQLGWAAAAGGLAGLACLTRSNGFLLVPVLALAVLGRSPWHARAALLPTAALFASAALTIAPWTVRNAVRFDAFVPITTQDGYGLAGQFNSATYADRSTPAGWRPPTLAPEYAGLFHKVGLDERELSAELRSRSVAFAREHPGSLPKAMYWNGRRMLNLWHARRVERIAARDMGIGTRLSDASVMSFWLVGTLAVLGAFTAAARRAPWFVWAVPLLMIMSVVPVSGLTRYRLPADPFIVLLAALALVAGVTRARARRMRVASSPQ